MIENDFRICFQAIETSKLAELSNSLFRSAVRYAHIRAEWHFMSANEKLDEDEERSRAHNTFIDKCNILSRNQQATGEDGSWRILLGNDRQIIGDFACYIHCWLGIQSR